MLAGTGRIAGMARSYTTLAQADGFILSLFGSGSSGLGFALVADGFLRQFGWLRQANSGSIGAKQTAKMTKKTPPARRTKCRLMENLG